MFYRQKGLKMTKLTHPPFNRWLLSGEPLSPEQNTILQEHLRYCPECSQLQAAWGEAQLQLSSAGQVAPAPGFTRRFQQRLALQRVKRQRRSSWMLFLGAAGMALFILSLIFWQIAGTFNPPASLLSGLVYLWTYVFVFTERLTDIFGSAARILPSITFVGMVFLVGFSTLMSVLWLVTYRQLTQGRREISW